MNAPDIQALRQALPDLDWTTDAERLAVLSKDFSWFSPILKRELAGAVADVAVRPRDQAELARLVAACAQRGLPLTLRGSGTGNYGQCTPLQGGVLVEMGALKQLLWQRGGVARAQAGIRLADLERQLREHGQELRTMPSTYRLATLGGLFAGGFGGLGSITYGPIAAPGNVLGARVMSVEPEPQVVELRGADALALHHTWGTTAILLELELATAPAETWVERVAAFDHFDAALDFAQAVSVSPGIPKRNVSVLDRPMAQFLPRWEGALPEGRDLALRVVAAAAEETVRDLAQRHGGQVVHRADSVEAHRRNRSLLELGWNHSTLHALRADPGLTNLQCSFTAGQHVDQVRAVRRHFGEQLLMHVEFIRASDGPLICTALPLLRYEGEAHLQTVIDALRGLGVRVNSPHHRHVEDGRFGGTLPAGAVAAKRRFDPQALLNPGKLRVWPVADS